MINAYYAELTDVLFNDATALSTSYAVENTDVFLPAPVAVTMGGSVALAGAPKSAKAQSVSFVGRTSSGLRAVIYQYGTAFQAGAFGEGEDFRIVPVENSAIDAAIATLNSIVDLFLCGNDGNYVTWYPYANVKYNDYWMRKVRQGS